MDKLGLGEMALMEGTGIIYLLIRVLQCQFGGLILFVKYHVGGFI
jgi:hypothetical protein